MFMLFVRICSLSCYLNFDSDAEHDSSLSISIYLPYTFNETNSNSGMRVYKKFYNCLYLSFLYLPFFATIAIIETSIYNFSS